MSNPPNNYGINLPVTTLDALLGFLEKEEGYGQEGKMATF